MFRVRDRIENIDGVRNGKYISSNFTEVANEHSIEQITE